MRGIEGKIGAVRYAREHGIPILGLCLGLQCMVIEVARDLAGLAGANSAEFDPDTPHPVIATMADQEDVVAGERDMGGTMRLGLYPAALSRGHRVVEELYGRDAGGGAAPAPVRGQQRLPRARWRRPAWSSPGSSPDGRLVEFVELARDVHPFFVGHPGAPGVPVPAHPAAPAVQRADRRARPLARRADRPASAARRGAAASA